MRTIQAEVPDSMYDQAADFASRENIPLDRVMSLALAQALGAWTAQSDIAKLAAQADREKFLAALAKAPDVEPPEEDRWP